MQQGDWLRLVRAVVVALAFVGVVAAVPELGEHGWWTDSSGGGASGFVGAMALAGLGWYVHSADDRWLNWGLVSGLILSGVLIVVRLALVL
jgi:hypothetical protein